MKKLVTMLCGSGLQGARKNYEQPQLKSLCLAEAEDICAESTEIANPDIPGDGDLAKDGNDNYGSFKPWED